MPGMAHANITIQDFSAENNSFVFNKAELINEVTTAVLEQLSNKKAFAENLKEGGNQTMDKFNELLEKYGKTVEDITFEYENLTDEELESAFANAFEISKNSSSEEADFEEEESPVNTEKFDGSESTDESTSGSDEGSDEGSDGGSDEGSDDEHQSTSAIEDEDSTGTRVENSLEYSVTVNGVTKNFSVSLRDKINAVATLVNDTYSDLDNAWYDVDVYEDDGKYCVMHDWWIVLYVAIFGQIIFCEQTLNLYRQHENNVIGAGVKTQKQRDKSRNRWSALMCQSRDKFNYLCSKYNHLLTENIAQADAFYKRYGRQMDPKIRFYFGAFTHLFEKRIRGVFHYWRYFRYGYLGRDLYCTLCILGLTRKEDGQ